MRGPRSVALCRCARSIRPRIGRPAAPGVMGDMLHSGRVGLGQERRGRPVPRHHRRRAPVRRRGETAGLLGAAPSEALRPAGAARRRRHAGAAWALPHFHRSPTIVLPSGQETATLAHLPIEALRFRRHPRNAAAAGFKRVGALLDNPRAPFAARFPAELLRRLDQAFGRLPEPLAFLAPPPPTTACAS